MINRINETELYEISIRNNVILPKHPDGFVERLGISMISEDGTSFLQGLAVSDLVETSNGPDTILQYIWTNPECRGIGFGRVLRENMDRYTGDYLGKIKRSRQENDKKQKTKGLNLRKSSTNELKTDRKSDHIRKNERNETAVGEFELQVTNDGGKIDNYINEIYGDSLKYMKGHKDAILVTAQSVHESKVCGSLLLDIYETKRGTFCKLMNLLVDESYRRKGLAKSMLNKMVEVVKPYGCELILTNVYGADLKVVVNLLKGVGFEAGGELGKRVSMSMEL